MDCVGPVDFMSNLRLLKFYVPHNETELQKQYRAKRQEVQDWNQKFWTNHNKKYEQVSIIYYISVIVKNWLVFIFYGR